MLLRPSLFLFFFLHFIPSKQNCQHVKCPVRGGGAWGGGIPAVVSRGGEHRGGAEGGSTTGRDPMGIPILKPEQNKQTK